MLTRRLHTRQFSGRSRARFSLPRGAPVALSAVTDIGTGAAAEPTAVPVPVRVIARRGGVIEVENHSQTELRQVRFALAGPGVLGLSLPRKLEPGDRVRVVVRGHDLHNGKPAGNTVLVMRWFQPDGQELLWPIAL